MPYNPNCPACLEKRMHTDEEWSNHPGEGRGKRIAGDEQTVKPVLPDFTVLKLGEHGPSIRSAISLSHYLSSEASEERKHKGGEI